MAKHSKASLSVGRVGRLLRDEMASEGGACRLIVAGAEAETHRIALAADPLRQSEALVEMSLGAQPLRVTDEDVVLLLAGALSGGQLAVPLEQVRLARAGLVVVLPADSAAASAATQAALSAGAMSSELTVYDPVLPFVDSRLADAVAAVAGQHGPALAARLPSVRHAVVARLIRRAALENTAVGALIFVPGADMPVMTANQIRMVLRIARAYGVAVDPARVPEVLAVVGAGLGLRALGRQGLKMVPVAGWAMKGAIGFSGTLALGRAAAAYYESGMAGRLGSSAAVVPASLERRLPRSVTDVARRRLGKVLDPVDSARGRSPGKG